MYVFDNLNTCIVILNKISIENNCVIRVQCSVRFALSVV